MKKFLFINFMSEENETHPSVKKFIQKLATKAMSDSSMSSINVVESPKINTSECLTEDQKPYVNIYSSDNVRNFDFVKKIKEALLQIRTTMQDDDELSILIEGHGSVILEQHYLSHYNHGSHGDQSSVHCMISTRELFQEITKYLPTTKMDVTLVSCHGGKAQSYVHKLPVGAKLYTYTNPESPMPMLPSWFAFNDYPADMAFDANKFAKILVLERYNYEMSSYPSGHSITSDYVSDTLVIGESGAGVYEYTIDPLSLIHDTAKLREMYLAVRDNLSSPSEKINIIREFRNLAHTLRDLKEVEDLGFTNQQIKIATLFQHSPLITFAALCTDIKRPYESDMVDIYNSKVKGEIHLPLQEFKKIFDDSDLTISEKLESKGVILKLLSFSSNIYSRSLKPFATDDYINDLGEQIESYFDSIEGRAPDPSEATDLIKCKIGVSINKDSNFGQKIILVTISADYKLKNETIAYPIRVTNEELTDLLEGRYTSFSEFAARKADLIFNDFKESVARAIEAQESGDRRIAINPKIIEFTRKLQSILSEQTPEEISAMLKNDVLIKLISKVIDKEITSMKGADLLARAFNVEELDGDAITGLIQQVEERGGSLDGAFMKFEKFTGKVYFLNGSLNQVISYQNDYSELEFASEERDLSSTISYEGMIQLAPSSDSGAAAGSGVHDDAASMLAQEDLSLSGVDSSSVSGE